ncbi:MAG: LuxR C-terminal-related transcriptional regulator [Limnohabitans sp.]|jgi:DNA-binding NarL/FixJ family response regulator
MAIRVLLSHKHRAIAEGMASVIKNHGDMELVGTAYGDEETRHLSDEAAPHVVLMGVNPQAQSDVTMTRWLKLHHPNTHIVALTNDCDRSSIIQMLDAGAMGYVSTTSSIEEVMQGIRAAALGRVYLCQGAATAMVDSYRRAKGSGGMVRGQLGDREAQVLRLIADGYSSKEIARNLQIAPSTVEVHRRNIMRKVGLHKVADLTRYAIRNQMVAI